MAEDSLNPVKPKVLIGGEAIKFESLRLEQRMNDTHSFEVVCEFMSQDELWQKDPNELMEKVGADAVIHFEHVDKGGSLDFNGFVTDVQFDSWDTEPNHANYGHQSNRIHYVGHGKVVKLDHMRGLDSYVDTTLKDIINENQDKITGAAASVVCSPKFTNQLPYVARYNETLFAFFNRLSYTFGELFFYDGEKLNFGTPNDSDTTKLVLGNDLLGLRTTASLTPRNLSRYDYMDEDGKEIISDSKPKNPSGLMGKASHQTDTIFGSEKDLTYSEYPISLEKQMTDLLEARQKTADGSILNVEGVTHTCKLKLGGQVEIGFPSEMGVSSLGKYRIMYIEHTVDKMGNYSNYFVGAPVGYEPVRSIMEPIKAFPEVATVTSNSDPENMGRVQVQFDWQKPVSKNTNWIRVQTPDAGGSGMKNRGMVFIPEVGDQVMVGFEFGDPNRPYVMGSMFNGKTGMGGDSDNQFHSLMTKSGLRFEFNDNSSDCGITLIDKNGNQIHLKSAGNSIEIIANEEITLKAKNIKMNATENISIIAGKDLDTTAKGNCSHTVQGDQETSIKGDLTQTVSGEGDVTIEKAYSVSVSKDMELSVDGKLTASAKKDLKCDTSGNGTVSATKKLNLTGGSNVYVGK